MRATTLTLFLAGDVMTGRGVDQILRHPGDPTLHEEWLHDAREYVTLAERSAGPIPRQVPPEYLWGDLLEALARAAPDARIINLETAVTAADAFAPAKEIHYRMHPANLECLTPARLDACVLSNNHSLDFGRRGLVDTLEHLRAHGQRCVGAGMHADEAESGVRIGERLLVFARGTDSSGIPPDWAAGPTHPGVARTELSSDAADRLLRCVDETRQRDDRIVVSIHWGSNWGRAIAQEQVDFAHYLIDGGVDLIHGHSSHHPRAIEVYRDKLILYGCGDLIDDYEGISGYEEFGPDLRPTYFAELDPSTGDLRQLRIVPFRSRRMRLERGSPEDAQWLAQELTKVSARFGCSFMATDDDVRLSRAEPTAPLRPSR